MAIDTRALTALTASQIASTVGSSIAAFGASIWVYTQTGSATLLSIVFLASLVPGAAVSTFAGVAADRYDRRIVMLAADSFAALATLAAAVLFGLGALVWWHVAIVAACVAVAGAFQDPAYTAALPAMTSGERLARLNGVVQFGPALALVVGPAVGGALVAAVGVGAVFAVDLLTFGVAVCVLAVVRFPGRRAAASESGPPSAAAVGGWRQYRCTPGLAVLAGVGSGVNFFVGFVNVLLLPLVLAFAGERSAGVVLALAGVGMLAGSALMSARRPTGSTVSTIAVGVAVLGAGSMAMSLRPSVVVVGAGLLLLAVPVPVVNASIQTLLQLSVPDEVRGRVSGVYRAVVTAAMPLSYLLAGPLADSVLEPAMAPGGWLADTAGRLLGTGAGRGVAALFLLCGVGVVFVGVATARSRSLRQLEQHVGAVQAAPPTTGEASRATVAPA